MAAVLRDSNDAIMLLDFEGRITSWNRGAERLYGYSEAEAVKLNIGDLVRKDERAQQEELLQRIARGEEIESFEIRRVGKDGRLLDIWSTITRLDDDRGAPTAIAVTPRDITDRKRIESALRESEERFRLLFERGMDAIVVADDDGNYLLANPAACELLGYARDQLLRMNVADLVTLNPPDAATQYASYVPAGRGAGMFHFLRSGHGGEERIAEYAVAEFLPGQHLSILRDVTEREQARQKLSRREQEFKALV
jgi:PAS domain S-box-containing protein